VVLGQEGAALRTPRPPRPHAPTAEELAAHEAMLEAIKSPLWLAGGSS
jgi:DNA polymerase III subunit epsilon